MSVMLGTLEELILLALSRHEGQSTVTAMRGALRDAGMAASGGAIDQTLRRMVVKSYVTSKLEGPRPRGPDVTRRWFLTDQGRGALERAEKTRAALRKP